nr:hypothetical protein BaRGS_022534 [Batillaria attramentaria]
MTHDMKIPCVGARTVIHPKARIIAEAGPVVIGEFNIIEELVHITNKLAQNLQIDFLTKILPNYHYLKKVTKAPSPQK